MNFRNEWNINSMVAHVAYVLAFKAQIWAVISITIYNFTFCKLYCCILIYISFMFLEKTSVASVGKEINWFVNLYPQENKLFVQDYFAISKRQFQ